MKNHKKLLLLIESNKIARHNTLGYNFPFFTRNPERPKYKDDFNEIVGIIARTSLNKQKDLLNIDDTYRRNIVKNLKFEGIEEFIVLDIFKLNFASVIKTNMFLYYPVKANNKKESDELRGKKILAEYINKLLQLDENDAWKKLMSEEESSEVYEDFVRSNLPDLKDSKDKVKKFNFFNQDKYVELFNHDLTVLMQNEQFFNKHISLLISYYYFYYVIQEAFNLSKKERTEFKSYYAFDKEKVSAGRRAVKQGYSIIQKISKNILLDNDLLNYLNELIGDDKFYTLAEIYSDIEIKQKLRSELVDFNVGYAYIHGLNYEYSIELPDLIDSLKSMLAKKNISPETSSRYRKSFDEFSNLSFTKRRGRYGYVFNATEELVLMFASIIVGNKERVLLRDLFRSFEQRGLYFDKASQTKIVEYFARLNILDKLSDSGDAQYVRSIL